ncbi:MAG: TIGR02281 family clan AA aspartic protease [Gammaproteobacteria bacterium]
MSTHKTGSMMYVLAVAALIGLLTWLFAERLAERRNPNRDVLSSVTDGGVARVVLVRNRAGHYVASGRIEDVDAEFIVDTGATDVAVSVEVAAAAGLRRGRPRAVATANGQAIAYATRIGRIALGEIVERDVPATIVPNMGDIEVLLGMSFLSRLDFRQRGDRLELEQRPLAAAGGNGHSL